MTVPTDSNNQFDPWQLPEGGYLSTGGVRRARHSPLRVATIRNVEPLDQQFGVQPKKTVPEILYSTLFGLSEPSAAEIAAAGDDPAAVLPMQTYAVLDAAKIVNLPELLGTSGLEHRCLITGKSYDELKNVAPWIARLEDGNDFTRRLFTGSNGINGLWDKDPGIYVRSRGTLQDMWKHFRKFIRVQDESGTWFYFRFWEAGYAENYFSALSTYPRKLRAWLTTDSDKFLNIGIGSHDSFTTFSYRPDIQVPEHQKRTFRYEVPERTAHVQAKRREFIGKLRGHLCMTSMKFADLDVQRQEQLVWYFVQSAAQFGMKIERSVADFSAASVLSGQPLEEDLECLRIMKSDIHQLDKGMKLLTIVRSRRKL